MSTLGQKLNARKELVETMNSLSECINEEEAENLNRLFSIFDKDLVLEKNIKGVYEIDNIKRLQDKCFEITKKEYSAKFMAHIATIQMFEE